MARSAKPALHLIQPRRVCRRVVKVMFVRRVIVHNQVHVKLFRKTGVQGTAEIAARKTSRTRSNTAKDNVRKQCATARKTDERDMNAQDCTLQNASGARFRRGRSFWGVQVAFDPPAVARMQTVVLMFRHFSPSWLCENAQMIIGVMTWPVKRGTKREVKQSSRGEVWPH
jgi:hypothetical protein